MEVQLEQQHKIPKPPVFPATGPMQQSTQMNWADMIQYFTGQGKVNRAAIFDKKGKQLAGIKDLNVPQDEIVSIVRCLNTNFVALNKPHFGLFFGEDRYLCFRAGPSTVIGRTKTDFFVAHLCEDILILAFATIVVEPRFSCLREVWTFAKELRSRMEISAFIG